MTIPVPRGPRPRDFLTAELRRLHDRRSALQGEVLDRLASLDALDQRITGLLDELADAVRPPVP